MSWPTDGLPRFKVAEPYSYRDYDGHIYHVCHVYDRAYCHETVYTARAMPYRKADAVAAAKATAARMEREN